MSVKLKIEESSGNVFFDIGFGIVEAENLRLRSSLMIRIEEYVKQSGLTQTKAAQALGVTKLRLNQLLKGKIKLFTLDALVNMLSQAGMRVNMTVKKAA